MIHGYSSDDPVVRSVMALLEATVQHGKEIEVLAWDKLPEQTRQMFIDQAKAKGYGEGYARYVLVPQYFADKKYDKASYIEPLSLGGDDLYMGSIVHGIEKYNLEQDQQILQSENLVEAYNAAINGRFEEARIMYEKMSAIWQANATKDPANHGTVSDYGNAKNTERRIVVIELNKLNKMAEEWNLSEADIKRLICDAYYQPSNDPEEIKRIVNARIDYNNMMIQLFRDMSNQNYAILGITKEEADLLIAQLDSGNAKEQQDAMVKIRTAIASKSKEYMIDKKSFDLRPLGAGVYLETYEDQGLDSYFTPERVTQLVMQYDCVISAHGGNTSKSGTVAYDRSMSRYDKERLRVSTEQQASADSDKYVQIVVNSIGIDEFKKRYRAIAETQKRKDLLDSQEEELDNKRPSIDDEDAYDAWYDKTTKLRRERRKLESDLYDSVHELIDEIYDALYQNEHTDEELNIVLSWNEISDLDFVNKIISQKNASASNWDDEKKMLEKTKRKIDKRYAKVNKHNSEWTMQPIKAPNGKTYTKMNDLVLAMIGMGCKSFYISSCNPGHHQLSPEILKKPGITVRYATNSLLVENHHVFYAQTDPDDPYGEIENTLCEVETELSAICESIGVDYLDDNAIDEAAKPALEMESFLNEGVLANIWKALVKVIKSAISLLVKLFKGIVNFVRKAITAIKNFFAKIFKRADGKKFSKPIKTGAILVEDAHMNSYQAKSWREVQTALLRSCDAISKKIQKTEGVQMKNMELMRTYSERMSQTVQESANPLFDHIISISFL